MVGRFDQEDVGIVQAVPLIGPENVDGTSIGRIADIACGDGKSVAPGDSGYVEGPTARLGRYEHVSTKRHTAVKRTVKHDAQRSRPCRIDFTIRADGRNGALDGIVIVDAISPLVTYSHRNRPRSTAVGRAGKENPRAVGRCSAPVRVEFSPCHVEIVVIRCLRVVARHPLLVLLSWGAYRCGGRIVPGDSSV